MKVLGKAPAGERLKRIRLSPHYQDGTFQNIEKTEVMLKGVSPLKMMRDFINKPVTVKPGQPLPVIKTDLKNIAANTPAFVWFGHSSYFIKHYNFSILVDPVLVNYASPFSFIIKGFTGLEAYSPADLPPIDLLIITHDHYDHLNYETISQIKDKVKKIVVPLGVGEHLEYWGIAPEKITELDWWEDTQINKNIKLTATPARHFSGRGFTRNNTLWTSYVLELQGYKIFLGGDSGYDAQFKVIGNKFGPFDLALLECGQYGINWPYIHMLPEQTVQAALDLQTEVLWPIHWGKFALAYHPWDEPITRVLAAAAPHNLPVATPAIGETYVLGDSTATRTWWQL
ncbi:MBL fold metallo-hydrolase [Adhaeribacter aquaticus]|uniref:MBL fold metallo-hydrolase n=1 Tax=Adhaeribacter aquaticus TaxID=299567 RepID=UPI00047D18CA|nr:MBL fold metallo-hydrolase [Adhaeribacter aquaticus]